jgi:hypothetical protein
MDEFEAKRLDTIIQLLANIDARLETMQPKEKKTEEE